MIKRRGLVACALCAVAASPAMAAGFSRKVLSKTELPGDKYICVLVEVEIEPNGVVERHTHPGVESSYIVSGSSTLSVAGQPDRVVKAGDGFEIPVGVPHSVRNGPDKTVVAATFTVEKDKPLASPAPE